MQNLFSFSLGPFLFLCRPVWRLCCFLRVRLLRERGAPLKGTCAQLTLFECHISSFLPSPLLCSGMTPGGARGTYGVPGFKPGRAMCQGRALPHGTVLSLSPPSLPVSCCSQCCCLWSALSTQRPPRSSSFPGGPAVPPLLPTVAYSLLPHLRCLCECRARGRSADHSRPSVVCVLVS